MNTSFTNGPWKINGNSIMGQKPHQIFARTVAFVPDGPGSPSDEGVANARLIAAAPELLTQLARAVSALDAERIHCTPDKATPQIFAWWDDILSKARAAINLATGQ